MHLTSSDGLPDNHARFVYQDSYGYIYAGTRNGMCRYDGYIFSTATSGDSAQVPPREFSAMIQSKYGFFTVAATGIYEYDRFANSLYLSRALQLLDEACFAEYHGTLLCGNSSGLFIFDPASREWTESSHLLSGIDQIHVRSMLVSDSDELLIGTNRGLFRYDRDMNLIDSDLGTDPYYHDINGIAQDDRGVYWISTFMNLYALDSAFVKISDFSEEFEDQHIRCIELDPYQRIWVGGEFGIVIIDPRMGERTSVYRDIGREQGLNDNAVYCIYRDDSENMWVGTYFGGINLWNGDFDRFTVFFPGSGEKNTSGKVVREMAEDSSGNLWLALEDGGLNYLDQSNGKITRFFFEGENEYKNVHSLIYEGDLLWLGSFNSGIESYRIAFREGVPGLTPVASYIPDEMVFDIDADAEGNIYAGSVGQVYRLDRRTGFLSLVNEDAFSSLVIYVLKVLPDDNLLLGTLRNGLYHYNTDNHIATAFSSKPEFLSMQTISYISNSDTTGSLVTCSDGLYRYEWQENKLKRIMPAGENSEFRAVLTDNESGFWISTTNGLLYADPARSVELRYNRYDGLPENQFNFNSAFRSSGGRYYFGTYNGLTCFFPEELKQLKTDIPRVSFTGYTVVGDDRTTLESHFMDNTITELRLKPYQTILSLEFSTLGFSRTNDVDYQFRMAGESLNWDLMENSRSLTLTNLGKGWHHLEIRAAVDGTASPEITTLRIYRQPAAWQTVYAYVIYALILVSVFLLVRRDYLRRQKARQALAIERFEKESQEKLNEQKMRFFLNISHEFRTPLTIIGGTITNIMKKFHVEKDMVQKLEIIRNTSENLNKLVNDFLEYGKLDAGFKPVELKKGPLMLFIRKACDMFDNWAEVNQLTYQKNIEDNREMAFFDGFKLERVLYNLLSNAFKFNRSNGEVVAEARINRGDNSWLQLIVSDNGPGMDEATLRRLQQKFRNADASPGSDKGIGLTYTAGLVRQMGGKISVDSEQGTGSVFSVEIPLLLSDAPYEADLTGVEPSIGAESREETDQKGTLVRKENRAHILVIDDNPDLLAMLSDSLGTEYNLTLSGSPVKALDMVCQYDFDLVVCDIMMPEMSGFKVIERIHSDILTSHIPILVLTAAADKEIELKGYRKGAVSYLAKPFRTEELEVKIESILSLRRELIRRYHSGVDLPAENLTHTARDEQFLKQATGVVHAHLEDVDFSVDRFCAEMKVSRTLLHTKLKHITGLSTTEFIRTIRLKKAYVLLKKGNYSVSEVAYACGFNDPNYFSRCFRKMYNVFPSKVKA